MRWDGSSDLRLAEALLIWHDDASSPSPARRSTSGVFPEEGPSDGQVSIQERNNVERERGREIIFFLMYVSSHDVAPLSRGNC